MGNGILFFTKGDKTVGSSRQRVWFVAEKLKGQYGIDFEVLHSMSYSSFSLRAEHFKKCNFLRRKIQDAKYKILFVHKSLFPWDVVLLILMGKFLFGKRLVYDLDDAEWEHSFLKTWLFVKSAHTVFCGSHVILDWVKKYTPNALYIPTVVDADLYKSFSVKHAQRDILTIGWVGVGRAHFLDGHFAMIKPALDTLAQKGFRFRFVIIGSQYHQPLKDYFRGCMFETIFIDELLWADPASVPRAIQQYQFDIGVMPISDTPFNRAKCAFKAIEYMACGVPAVASPIGETNMLIKDGKTGFFAHTMKEWVFVLGKLAGSIELRKSMGIQAQQNIQRAYSYHAIISLMHAALRDMSKSRM